MARKDFGAKPLSFPQPVLIVAAYDDKGVPNAMNAAWGGIRDFNEVDLCLSKNHKTVKNLRKTGAFTIGMGDVKNLVACDYVGIVSGNEYPDKMERAGFTVTPSEKVNAPIINELAVCMECKVVDYDPKTCILHGEIINVNVDEAALTDGKVDLDKVQPISFDPFNNEYRAVGAKVGNAYSEGKILKKKAAQTK